MAKLEKNLNEWVAHGLLSEGQAQRIRAHEASKPESSWILYGLLILGAMIVGIGVISLIAANWNQIPDDIKIIGNFILLIGLAWATYNCFESKKTIQFEVLLLFFLIHCLASIGLISQIYHTGGKFHQALMFWSLITLMAAISARAMFVPFVWTGAFIFGLVFSFIDSTLLQTIFHNNYPALFMTTALLCGSLSITSKMISNESGATRAARAWTILSGLFALISAELREFPFYQMKQDLLAYVPGYFLGALILIGVWRNHEYRKIQKILITSTLLLFLIPYHMPLLQIKSLIAYAICTILVLSLSSIFLASLKQRRLFQWFLILIGLRFLILYFQAIGGLATTGFGLILSGGVVIGMAMLWNKYKTSLADWAERLAQ